MTPEFESIVNPVFITVLKQLEFLEHKPGADLKEAKYKIVDAFQSADLRAKRVSKSEDWELARHALIYWTDEVLTNADSRWQELILERDFYNKRQRATDFYVYGERDARHSKHYSSDVLEVWYLALVLGFEGDIETAFHQMEQDSLPGGTHDPDKSRLAWAEQLRKRISRNDPPALEGPPLDRVGWTRDDGSSALQAAAWFLGVMVAAAAVLLYARWEQ